MMNKDDVKIDRAPKYPGKWTRNNKSGSPLSRCEYLESEAKKWVDKVKDLDKYNTTSTTAKTHLLREHLGSMNVAFSRAKKLLINAESTIEEFDTESNEESNQLEETGNSDQSDMEVDEGEPDSRSRHSKEIEVSQALQLSDDDMFADEAEITDTVKKSSKYKERKKNFVAKYVEEKSSQDLLTQFSQAPKVVKDSDEFKSRLCHLSKEQKSEKRLLKNLNETIEKLKENPSQEAINQRKIIYAAANDPRFGNPGLNEFRTFTKDARKTKLEFLAGDKNDLKPNEYKKNEYFPEEVKKIAETCWRDQCTIVEPAKHAGPKKAVKDGQEMRPTIYQVLTDQECYDQFKEHYNNAISIALAKYCQNLRDKMQTQNETPRKIARLERLARKEATFPSKSWFLYQKPPETKPMHDHTTGLCRVCESIRLNYDTLLKAVTKNCQCQTKRCEQFFCSCEQDEEGEMPAVCPCQKCDCDDCLLCQVG